MVQLDTVGHVVAVRIRVVRVGPPLGLCLGVEAIPVGVDGQVHAAGVGSEAELEVGVPGVLVPVGIRAGDQRCPSGW